MAEEYNFQYTPLTGRLPGKSFVEQTEKAINELAGIVNNGSAQVEAITNLANTANDNSEEALEKANEALETSGRVYITLPNLDDANDYFDSQLYYFENEYSANLPVQDTGFLEVKTNDTKTAAEQVFIADTTGLCYFRHGDITSSKVGAETVYSVTWQPWSSELASEGYVQNEVAKYLPLTGGTLTGELYSKRINNQFDFEKGTVPSGTKYSAIYFTDNAGNAYSTDCIGLVESKVTNSNLSSTYIRAIKNEANSTVSCEISCNVDADGNAYTSAPTPTQTDNSSKIATTAFVKAQNYTTPSGFVVEEKSKSVTVNANTSVEVDINVTKSGYTALGIVGFRVSGSGATWVTYSHCYLSSATNADVILRNGTNNNYTWTVYVKILYVKS